MKRRRDDDTALWEQFVSSSEDLIVQEGPSEAHFSHRRIRLFFPRDKRIAYRKDIKYVVTPVTTVSVESNEGVPDQIVVTYDYKVTGKRVRFLEDGKDAGVFPAEVLAKLNLSNVELAQKLEAFIHRVRTFYPQAMRWESETLPYKIIVHKPLQQLILKFQFAKKEAEMFDFGKDAWVEYKDDKLFLLKVFDDLI